MKISIDEVPQSPKEIEFSESTEELSEIYGRSSHRDFTFPASLDVEMAYYRSGRDIFFNGKIGGIVTGRCGRCLEIYDFTLDKQFDFVLAPDPNKSARGNEELHRDDLGLSYYSAEEINLAPLMAEQVLLGLPTKPLCSENCRGLCGNCGANLNRETCSCSAAADPRMAIFRTLKVGR